jgi:hypothetical protein
LRAGRGAAAFFAGAFGFPFDLPAAAFAEASGFFSFFPAMD